MYVFPVVVGLRVTFEIKAAYLLTYLDFVKTKLFATCCAAGD